MLPVHAADTAELSHSQAGQCREEIQVLQVSYLFWSTFTFSTSLCKEVICKQKTLHETLKTKKAALQRREVGGREHSMQVLLQTRDGHMKIYRAKME